MLEGVLQQFSRGCRGSGGGHRAAKRLQVSYTELNVLSSWTLTLRQFNGRQIPSFEYIVGQFSQEVRSGFSMTSQHRQGASAEVQALFDYNQKNFKYDREMRQAVARYLSRGGCMP